MATATEKTILRAQGFSCPSCVTKIEKRLAGMPGVEDVQVHYASARIETDHDDTVSAEQLMDEVDRKSVV